MTAPRPGGSTPRGLRYPGNDITVDELPAAIADLANDTDRALGTSGSVTMQQINTSVYLNNGVPSSAVVFGNLSVVSGCVANWAQDNYATGIILQISGNSVTVIAPLTSGLYANPPLATPNPGPPVGTYTPQYAKDRWVGISLIAWGPPR